MNKTVLTVIITLVIGIGVLGVLFVTYKDDRIKSSDTVQLAEKLGVDIDQFLEDYQSSEVARIVEEDKEEALKILKDAGINGAQTPMVAINGVYYPRESGLTLTDMINQVLADTREEELPIFVNIYEDYKCSACAQFQSEIFEAYQKFTSNQVIIKKKHLPFLRPQSSSYAKAAEAVRNQDERAFEKYNIELFLLNHPNIKYDFYPFTDEALDKYFD
jgi:propanediol dehydratase small subunit